MKEALWDGIIINNIILVSGTIIYERSTAARTWFSVATGTMAKGKTRGEMVHVNDAAPSSMLIRTAIHLVFSSPGIS